MWINIFSSRKEAFSLVKVFAGTKQRMFKTLRICAALLFLTALLPGSHAEEALLNERGSAKRIDLPETFLKWGAFNVRPQVGGSVYYDDNFRTTPTNAQKDLIWNISPSVSGGLGNVRDLSGNLLLLNYAPNLVFFTDHDQNNSFDNVLSLLGQLQFSKLTLQLQQAYQNITAAVGDVGDRIEQTLYTTRLAGRYAYSSKTYFGLTAMQTIADYGQLNGFNEWTFDGLVDYKLTDKVTLGVTGGYKLRDVQGGANLTSEQVQVRGEYLLTGKLSLDGSIGADFRQFQGGLNEPASLIFSVGGAYRPKPGTSIRLEAARRDQCSILFGGQNFITTGFTATFSQQFWRKYAINLTGGYENADYRSTTLNTASVNRNDDNYLIAPSINAYLTSKWQVNVYYQYRENISSGNFSFVDNQVGLRSNYKF